MVSSGAWDAEDWVIEIHDHPCVWTGCAKGNNLATVVGSGVSHLTSEKELMTNGELFPYQGQISGSSGRATPESAHH